jgi:Zn-dependent protease with chaperone function
MYASLGKQMSQGLFEELKKSETLKPRLTPVKVLAILVATLVHVFILLLTFLGAYLLLTGGFSCFGIAGLLFLAIAIISLPRLPKLEKDDVIAPRDRFPTLYKIADDVASALHTSPVSAIVIDEGFNASYTQIGLRQKKVVYLGLPLLSILDAQEIVDLMGHELGHGVNGDMTRGLYVGSAISALIKWYRILHPGSLYDENEENPVLAFIAKLIMLPALGIVFAWIYILFHLIWRDSQRAEYLADALGAKVGGTSASLSALDKLHFGHIFSMALQTTSLNPGKKSLFDELRQQADEMPERELERIRRMRQMLASRLDATHPPTTYRIEALRARPVTEPEVVLTPEEFALLQSELIPLQSNIQQKLVDMHKDSLYY